MNINHNDVILIYKYNEITFLYGQKLRANTPA
jgi:hypothetical protein